MKDKKIPDFIGIGAQRAGTTWLWKNLEVHPGISLPPLKEIHYFSRSEKYLSPNLPDNIIKRFTNERSFWWKTQLEQVIKKKGFRKKMWFFKYAFGSYNDRWYCDLFSDKKEGQISGEISPAYSTLDVDDIKRVHSLVPDAKLIYIMRNPIDRTWSHFKLYARAYDKTVRT